MTNFPDDVFFLINKKYQVFKAVYKRIKSAKSE